MRILLCSAVLVLISACTVLGKFDIKKDGTSHVNFYIAPDDIGEDEDVDQMYDDEVDYQTDSLVAAWKAPFCENFELQYDEDGIKWSFDLEKVDQLGQYISEYFGYEVTFLKNEKSLIIDGPDGDFELEDDPDGYASMMKFDFTLNFEQKVKSVKSDCECAEMINDHTVRITSTVGDINYNQKENIITIKLK